MKRKITPPPLRKPWQLRLSLRVLLFLTLKISWRRAGRNGPPEEIRRAAEIFSEQPIITPYNKPLSKITL